MAFVDYLNPLKQAKSAFGLVGSGASKLFGGTPGGFEDVSNLTPEQQDLFSQLLQALQGEGAGGAFGQSADYYRDLLNPDSQQFDALANPELRRFNEQTIPGLAEQFAGMGAGGSGLSGSGFRNAAVSTGADLGERLSSMRAQLRQQGAAGLSALGQAGLSPVKENIYRQRVPGLAESLAPAVGTAAGAFLGPPGAAAGNMAGSWLSNQFKRSGASSGTPQQF